MLRQQKSEEFVMVKYVLGFAFIHSDTEVVMLRKQRPEFQAGKVNGVGGHIEEGESSLDAMIREFQEEALVDIPGKDWNFSHKLSNNECSIDIYSCFSDLAIQSTTTSDEQVLFIKLKELKELNEKQQLVSGVYSSIVKIIKERRESASKPSSIAV